MATSILNNIIEMLGDEKLPGIILPNPKAGAKEKAKGLSAPFAAALGLHRHWDRAELCAARREA